MSELNAMSALLRIDQLLLLKDSVARIIAGVMKPCMSCRNIESWKINRIMFRAWILASSLSAVLATFRRNVMVLFSRTGSLDMGSALSMEMMVGGMPADLLSVVLRFSVVIFSRALSSMWPGSELKCRSLD